MEDILEVPTFIRTYHYGDGRELPVKIWAPDESSVPMFCWFKIGDENIRRAPGLDPLEALFNAMKTIEMLLSGIRNNRDQGLHWKDATKEGDLGLPAFYGLEHQVSDPKGVDG
ncbi:DUF6968 family protein [Asticcacaulis sp. 201]|uniref:DUF6968 family protein n=1 Tax=Asticcacaulis sp. 201 TaxID=3028787 RepID=UPI00291678C4|nr:hypothetical protein [Asticcacaulis sp. 201]MDV6329980.1 hypothetical protein [Asticcacaulis sp. 201]